MLFVKKKCCRCGKPFLRAGASFGADLADRKQDPQLMGLTAVLFCRLFFGGSRRYCSDECAEEAFAKDPQHAIIEKTFLYHVLYFVTMISLIASIFMVFTADSKKLSQSFHYAIGALIICIVCWILRFFAIKNKRNKAMGNN